MKRNSKVRIAIKKSLIVLLENKPVSQVSIKELCENADISRAAFYKHFRDMNEFIESLEKEFLEDLQDKIGAAGEKGVKTGFREAFMFISELLKSDPELYRIICSKNCDMYFTTLAVDYCREYIEPDFKQRFHVLSDKTSEKLYSFVSQGCGGLLNSWIRNGMSDPVENLTEFAERLAAEVYKAES